MARRAKPWLRKGRGWYVQIDGKQVALGKDKARAFQHYHKLMQEGVQQQQALDSFFTVCDEFLEWTKQNRADRTYKYYLERLESFAKHYKDHSPSQYASDVRSHHIHSWLALHPGWGNTTKRQAIVAIQRCFNWAVRMGYIDRSPVQNLEKPQANTRNRIISVEEYQSILEHINDEAFRDLIVTSWETGCRPQESTRVEARHVDLDNSRWVFPPSEAKGKRKPRIVYLNEVAFEITKRRLIKHPEGPIFRNREGNPWHAYAINCRFQRLKNKLGTRYCLYLFRHSFATRMLESGLDALTVALLLGHSNPAMLSTTYQHLAHNPKHLLNQVQQASG